MYDAWQAQQNLQNALLNQQACQQQQQMQMLCAMQHAAVNPWNASADSYAKAIRQRLIERRGQRMDNRLERRRLQIRKRWLNRIGMGLAIGCGIPLAAVAIVECWKALLWAVLS